MKKQAPNRRAFLKAGAIASAGICAGAGLGGCFLLDEPEMKVGALSDLDQNGYLIVKFNRKQIMATRLEGQLVIFSLICRHKKCTVAWEADEEQFQCPCHEGTYDKYGEVIDGPPPGPLFRYRHEQRGEELWVLNEKY